VTGVEVWGRGRRGASGRTVCGLSARTLIDGLLRTRQGVIDAIGGKITERIEADRSLWQERKNMTRTSERHAVQQSIFARQKRINSKTRPIVETGQATELRFMTWNVLAQSRTADSFPLAPLESLEARSRGRRPVLACSRSRRVSY